MIDEDVEKAGGEPGDRDLEFGNNFPDIFDGEVGLGEDEGDLGGDGELRVWIEDDGGGVGDFQHWPKQGIVGGGIEWEIRCTESGESEEMLDGADRIGEDDGDAVT